MTKPDQSRITDYLQKERIGVLALELQDGSPHGAVMHFAHSADPFILYFATSSKSRKAQAFLGKTEVRATFVVGVVETVFETLQIDGVVRALASEEEESRFNEVYLSRFPEKADHVKNPGALRFLFVPEKWKFTDSNREVLTSE